MTDITFENRIDHMEKLLKQKIEQMSGFDSEEGCAVKLERTFRYFDCDHSGKVDYDEFFAAMVRLNFVGCQREIEGLFDRYDENCDGVVDYKELTHCLFNINGMKSKGVEYINIIDRVKDVIIKAGGANGIRTLKHILRRMDINGNNKIDREELYDGLMDYGIQISTDPGGDLDQIMNYFDRDGSNNIDIDELMIGLQGKMPRVRKLLLREAFTILDKSGDGVISCDDLIDAYDFSHTHEVTSGSISKEDAIKKLLANFEGHNGNGLITWAEFLSYYKVISMGIKDDEYFELMIRNAYHITGGEGAAQNSSNKRVLVTHSDGKQVVHEIQNDLGMGSKVGFRYLKMKLEEQGVEDIVRITLANE